MLKIILVVVVLGVAGLLVYIRLAPSDPARWHIDIAAADFIPPAHWAAYCPDPARQTFATFTAVAPLARLADIADSWPRTTRVAGSVEDGRITWLTRSRILGFPDYATAAQIQTPNGPAVCIVSRQRFGTEDGGVNAARLRGWLMRAFGADAPPELVWNP